MTAARALGADIVLCVNLNGGLKLRGTTIQSIHDDDDAHDPDHTTDDQVAENPGLLSPMLDPVLGAADRLRGRDPARRVAPGMAKVMIDAFNITQDRISRSRLAGDPPDLMISPKLARIGLFEFHRADEIIRLGGGGDASRPARYPRIARRSRRPRRSALIKALAIYCFSACCSASISDSRRFDHITDRDDADERTRSRPRERGRNLPSVIKRIRVIGISLHAAGHDVARHRIRHLLVKRCCAVAGERAD